MTAQWVDRLKLRQLRAILAIEEHGSVTLAAEHLFVTQAAVSKVVAELQAQIGTPLFERQGRGIAPTEAGRHVIQAARRIAGELRSLSDEVDLVTQGGSGVLVIGMQAVSIVHLLPKVLAAMKARYPRVTIRLIEDVLATVLRDLRGGRIDFVLGRMLPHLLGADLEGFRMPAVPYVVVASPSHPLLSDPAPSWAKACASMWAMPLPGAPIRAYFSDFLPQLLAGILGASPTLALVPLPMAEDWRRAGICQICALALSVQMEPIGLIWSKTIPLKPSARLFQAEIFAQWT
jgi:DNA-binding transcriptional LysR family regulator